MNRIENIKNYLAKRGVLDLVNLEDATKEPLPLLLSHTLLHLTHFSGTAIEASLFNVKTVLLNEIGVFSFPDLISNEKAVYLDVKAFEFAKNLKEVITVQRNKLKNTELIVESKQESLFN
jgi:hypothetical protein